ncbi:cytochrome P450 [Dictyobacter alpinus]|uniref:Cytochrome P450 n=1 Tax=Dictyobacter alpinus TaxID=2014873 RepID=A0A402B124_9CHLR|nr:cytochrome P450 [Dictyobacter alpinus]GCE25054.1 cytochrome P450 [Dictyobacter alpinus]
MASIELGSPNFKANPYPIFANVRKNDPIKQVVLPGNRLGWLITRYEDAELALRDPRFIKDPRHLLSLEQLSKQFGRIVTEQEEGSQQAHQQPVFFERNMLGADPPDHTRLRSLVSLSFTPRFIERWRERIQTIAHELLDGVQGTGTMDLVNDFAFPLPMLIITEMLGVPRDDQARFRAWSNLFIESSGDPDAFRRNADQVRAFREYLRYLINEKRKLPAEDLISGLIAAESEGNKLSEGELISMVSLLLIAGHETTVNLISNGMLALLLHPEQKELLQQDPALIKSAIEEFLRFHGPLMTATQRWVSEDMELNGQQLKRGDYVVVVLASANHDEETFKHPDELDITRSDNRHLAFGKGIHYCLGAPLARLEGQIAISTLLQRLPHIQLAVAPEELIWRPGSLIMGLRALPVQF